MDPIRFEHHVKLTIVESPQSAAKLDQIISILNEVLREEQKLMSKAEEITASVEALRQAFSDATDEVARDLEDLRKQIKDGLAGGLTAAEAVALQAKIDADLGAAKDRLVELGKDPADPVPTP